MVLISNIKNNFSVIINMPLPTKKKSETEQEFVSRCMADDMVQKDYKDQKQRAAVCYSQFKRRMKNKGQASWDDVRKGDSLGLV
jgi:hypothetical protein